MAQLDPLEDAALRLRNASPDAFDAFLRALQEVSIKADSDAVNASPDLVLKMQGRAQVWRGLIQKLKDCSLPRTPKTAPATPVRSLGDVSKWPSI